jgi:hypothetical protein
MGTLPLDESNADLSGLSGRAASCAGPLARVPAMLVRGALAQAMFMRDFGSFRDQSDRERAFINLNLPIRTTLGNTRMLELYRWGDCVVRNDSAGTELLLRTEVASPDEAAAVAGLQDYMAACMPTGVQLQMRLWELRSILAQSAYQTAYRYWTGQLNIVRAH